MPKTQTEDGESASVQTQPTATTAAHAAQDAQAAQAAELGQPPVAPPVALYTNLPTEWPLARISVYTVQTHLIGEQEVQGFLLKRRDFLCS